MPPLSTLVSVYDNVMDWYAPTLPPTARSVERINSALGIELPGSILQFAKMSAKFGAWFASLGEDYESPFHIITVNGVFHAPDRPGYEREEWKPMPRHLVMFNHGHDDDCDCFDTSSRDSESGEYRTHYWNPFASHDQAFESFAAYMQRHITGWVEAKRGPERERLRRLLQS